MKHTSNYWSTHFVSVYDHIFGSLIKNLYIHVYVILSFPSFVYLSTWADMFFEYGEVIMPHATFISVPRNV